MIVVGVILAALATWVPRASAQTALSITGSLHNGMVGVAYHAALSATGGNPPYSWSMGGLPPGLTFKGPSVNGIPTTPGTFTVDVTVNDTPNSDGFSNTDSKQFVVTIAAPPPTTTTTTTTLRPPPPPTTTRPTVPRATTTTRPGATTTTTSTTVTTATTVAPTTVATTTTTLPPATLPPDTLQLSQPSIEPGGQLTAQGSGCSPGATVDLSIDAQTVGSAMADAQGNFSAPITVPDLALGSHTVVAACGPTLSSPLDLAVSTSSSNATGTLGVFLFFLLLILMLFRRRHYLRRPKPTRGSN